MSALVATLAPWEDLGRQLAGAVVVPLGEASTVGAPADPARAAATVHVAADAVLVGPWGGGPGGPCGRCLAMRWQRLRSRSEREALETGSARVAAGGWPVLPAWVVDAVRALRQRCVTAPPACGPGTALVTRLDLATLAVRTVPLLTEPLCPDCPVPPAGEPPLTLASRPKPSTGDYRLRSPASYRLPTDALANPVCGVLGAGTWLDVTSPTTAPVAGSVFMRGYAGLTDVTWSGQANSFAASRDLAFLEGLERYAGTHRRRPGPPLVAAYDDLGAAALDPRTCGTYSDRTYEEDPALSRFSPSTPIPWVRGHRLPDGRPVLVPARLCYYSAGVAADSFVFECSNGCATGSCLEEAVLFGLLELIERDAFLLAWYGDAVLTAIDLDSVPAGPVRTMRQRAELLGYDVHAFDNRVDLPVPVVTAVAVRRDGGPGTLAFAAGAAFEPAAAVEAAVCEILTYIPHLPRQVAERPAELAAMARDFDLVRRLPDHAALFGLPEMAGHADSYLRPAAVRPLDAVYRTWQERRPRSVDLRDDLMVVLDALATAGLDAIVVDQTAPEQDRMGLRTVCTLVPGLLPIDFGWARQRALGLPRLRTAFRRAGWRTDDLGDDELRRVPHPFP